MKGIFEKNPGSGVWWVRYADGNGKPRRETAGTKSAAITLYQKRKTEILQGRKLPENLRAKAVKFSVLAEDALTYSRNSKPGSYKQDEYRMKPLVEEFGNRSADTITSHELATWLADKANERSWEPGTVNRFKALLSLTYRLGVDSKKVSANPAGKGLKRRRESNGRTRFLNQFEPAKTFVDYLKPHRDEEARLRVVIATEYAEHMPEFEIALHTGMRPSEQYRLNRCQVDLVRGLVTISKSKNGEARHIPLNSIALGAFRTLMGRDGEPTDPVFVSIRLAKDELTGEQKIQRLKGYKHWFDPAVYTAGLRDFSWYCLRHTFASRLVMDGVDLPTVSYFMGHKTIQMTMKYAHLAPAHKLAAIERLVSFGKAPVGKKPPKPTDTKTDTKVFASL
jgi:integrase